LIYRLDSPVLAFTHAILVLLVLATSLLGGFFDVALATLVAATRRTTGGQENIVSVCSQ
jgi:hypothetical protein